MQVNSWGKRVRGGDRPFFCDAMGWKARKYISRWDIRKNKKSRSSRRSLESIIRWVGSGHDPLTAARPNKNLAKEFSSEKVTGGVYLQQRAGWGAGGNYKNQNRIAGGQVGGLETPDFAGFCNGLKEGKRNVIGDRDL